MPRQKEKTSCKKFQRQIIYAIFIQWVLPFWLAAIWLRAFVTPHLPPLPTKNKVENQTKTPSAKCAAIKKVVQKKEKKKKEVTKNNQVHALYKDMVYKYRKQSKVAIKWKQMNCLFNAPLASAEVGGQRVVCGVFVVWTICTTHGHGGSSWNTQNV